MELYTSQPLPFGRFVPIRTETMPLGDFPSGMRGYLARLMGLEKEKARQGRAFS